MNQDQLKHAAYKYCEYMGLDPEKIVGHAPVPDENGTIYSVLMYSRQWQLVATRIKDHHAMNLAIEAGKNWHGEEFEIAGKNMLNQS